VALAERTPFFRLAVAQPEHRGADMSRHRFAPAYHDRHLGTGRSEDLRPLALIADCPAIERLLDPGVCHSAALSDGGCEIGMTAAPVLHSCDVDLEEIGNFARLSAESAELADLGGESWVVG